MKKIILLISCLFIFSCIRCNKKTVTDSTGNNCILTDIHWGTTHNTLRGVTISWRGTADNDSIRWGYTSDYEFGAYAGKYKQTYQDHYYEYSFPILKPASRLHYSFKLGYNWSEDFTFLTAVDTSATRFSFTIGSDSQCGKTHDGNLRWQRISKKLTAEDSEFHLHAGDVVHRGANPTHWECYFKYGKDFLKNKLVFYSWGNHEYHSNALENFVLPGNEKWYSFTQGNCLFICLLTEEDLEKQHSFLLRQLQHNDKEWIFVIFHRPFFTRGSHKDEMNEQRATWWKAFDDYGVDFVISGHTHSYIRTVPLNLNISDTTAMSMYGSLPNQGRMQFVTGGLGGDNSRISKDWFAQKAFSGVHYIKFQIDEDELYFQTCAETGAVIDSLTMHSEGTHN